MPKAFLCYQAYSRHLLTYPIECLDEEPSKSCEDRTWNKLEDETVQPHVDGEDRLVENLSRGK